MKSNKMLKLAWKKASKRCVGCLLYTSSTAGLLSSVKTEVLFNSIAEGEQTYLPYLLDVYKRQPQHIQGRMQT